MSEHKIRIPIVVTKSGAIQTGSVWRHSSGKEGSAHDYCYDGFDEDDYLTGTAVVHVTAELDIEAIFRDREIEGEVDLQTTDKEKKQMASTHDFFSAKRQTDACIVSVTRSTSIWHKLWLWCRGWRRVDREPTNTIQDAEGLSIDYRQAVWMRRSGTTAEYIMGDPRLDIAVDGQKICKTLRGGLATKVFSCLSNMMAELHAHKTQKE